MLLFYVDSVSFGLKKKIFNEEMKKIKKKVFREYLTNLTQAINFILKLCYTIKITDHKTYD